ncbi:hypothetical protein HDV00_000406 [Rhizophlyctis rosea]|nr:hypothetical protein HDV00_000406 [Rhizophlyctis rosea]
MPPRGSSRKVTGGGSLIVGYRLANKHVLIVGGGKEASGRVFFALDADAIVTIICPLSGLNEEVAERVLAGEIVHVDREFQDDDLWRRNERNENTLVDMVLSCIDNHEESRRIAVLCRQYRIPVNCADIPDLCDFYFMAQHRDGDLQIGVSTNGCGPRLGARLRDHVRDSLPPRVGEAVKKVGELRGKVRTVFPDMTEEAVNRRMRWLSALCNEWSYEELADINSEDVVRLIGAFERGEQVPPSGKRRPGATTNGTANGKSRRVSVSQAQATTAQNLLTSYARSVPIVGGLLAPVAAIAGTTLHMATSTVSSGVNVASNIITSVKTTTETIVDTSLNILPAPLASPIRTTLSYIPLPIHIASGKPGHISLVGAGPGDPGLLTTAALKALQTADLVVSDQLVPPKILALIPARKLKLAKKKEGGKSDASQDDTNAICLDALQKGLKVVRLKGGDPFLFGRGGEEVIFFRARGFNPEVIPGLSSCIAAPASVDIPVTHRGVADQVLILSGRGEGGALPTIPEHYEKRTTVVLMAVARLPLLVKEMVAKGYPADLPVAVVEKGCWQGEERKVEGTVGDICERVEREKVGSPALLVVGGVVNALK